MKSLSNDAYHKGEKQKQEIKTNANGRNIQAPSES